MSVAVCEHWPCFNDDHRSRKLVTRANTD